MQARPRTHWFTVLEPPPVSMRRLRVRPAVPQRHTSLGSFSHAPIASSEFHRWWTRPPPFGEVHHLPGFHSLFATSPRGVCSTWDLPAPPPAVPGFLSPSTTLSTSWLHGLVSSRSRVQGSLSRGFSPHPVPPLSSSGAAPLPFTCDSRSRARKRARCHGGRLRLRGLVPDGDAFASDRLCTRPKAAPLFSFSPPPGTPPPPRESGYPGLPLLTFLPAGLRVGARPWARLQRVFGVEAGSSVSRLPTCSRFRAVRDDNARRRGSLRFPTDDP